MLERIALITGNAGKAAEYAAMLGIDVNPAKAELTEVQSLDVAAVAARKAADAYAQLGTPVLVDERTIRPVEPWCSWFRHLAYQDKAAKAMREYAYIVLWFALS